MARLEGLETDVCVEFCEAESAFISLKDFFVVVAKLQRIKSKVAIQADMKTSV